MATPTHDHSHELDVADGSVAARRRTDPMAATQHAAGLPVGAGNRAISQVVQRRGDGLAEEVDHGAMVQRAISGGGQALDPGVRSSLEAHTGHSLADVTVHTGPAASQAAASVSAEAFTVGNHIVFDSGAYNPSTADGMHRIAHEAQHVVQQRQGPVSATDTGTGVALSDPGDSFEREAEASAHAFSRGT